jgi:hypothetical protein
MSPNVTTQSPPDPSPAEHSTHDRRMFIGTMIALATVLFLITSGVLYVRWATMNEPNCVIVIKASPSLKGAEVTVDNIMFTQPLKVTIGEKDRYSIPFYVDPGDYDVTIRLDGDVQHEGQVTVSNAARGQLLDLTKFKPTTSPATPTTAQGAP